MTSGERGRNDGVGGGGGRRRDITGSWRGVQSASDGGTALGHSNSFNRRVARTGTDIKSARISDGKSPGVIIPTFGGGII